jgi:phosphoglycerate dehydrogenase-like enzyme
MSLPSHELAEDLGRRDDVEIVVWDFSTPAPRDRFDIVVLPAQGVSEALPRLEGVSVGVVQGQGIGYENVIDNLPSGLRFANGAGVFEASTAELAVALTLAAQRLIPHFVTAQQSGIWNPECADSLAHRTVCLLGFGGVGKAISTRLAGFDVTMVAVASRARTEDQITVFPVSELHEVLRTVDILIVSLPSSPGTRHLVDDAVLSALPDGALVVNVGRGSVIDTDALVAHLEHGRLRAALDVTDPEPLPHGHPLWTLRNVLISPHVGGATDAVRKAMSRLIHYQVDQALAGKTPVNVVIER